MENSNIILSEFANSTMSVFGFGFLAGSLFSILILLIFDWLKSRNENA